MSRPVRSAVRDAIVARLAAAGTPVAPHAVHAVLAGEGVQPTTIRAVHAEARRMGAWVGGAL